MDLHYRIDGFSYFENKPPPQDQKRKRLQATAYIIIPRNIPPDKCAAYPAPVYQCKGPFRPINTAGKRHNRKIIHLFPDILYPFTKMDCYFYKVQ